MGEATGGHEGLNKKTEGREYDLAERTTRFAEDIVIFAKKMPRDPVTTPIITQLVKAGTSVGANYREANESVSLREFRNKIGYCKKEANETKYWLRITAKAVPGMADDARNLWREAKELHMVFAASFRTTSNKLAAKKAQ